MYRNVQAEAGDAGLSPPQEVILKLPVLLSLGSAFGLALFSSSLSLNTGLNSTSLATHAWQDQRLSLSQLLQQSVQECPSLSQSLWPAGSGWLGLCHISPWMRLLTHLTDEKILSVGKIK